MKVLITGAKGQLGLALTRRLSAAHEVISVDRSQLDISDALACQQALARHQPDLVLNCAAYTAVDRAESEPDLAYAINAKGSAHLARACDEHNAVLLHFSTDYVFNGKANRPYLESDTTAPLGVYGSSKLAGEQAVLAASAAHYVFRLSWVYSNDGANFYKTMLRLAAERPALRVVADQYGAPNYTADLADAIAHVVQQPPAALRHNAGLYHLSASGETHWQAFASAILQEAGDFPHVVVNAITTRDYPTPAQRPQYSVLDSSRFSATFAYAIPTWQDGLKRCLSERKNG